MKVRIKGNSICYRLTCPEVEQFILNGIVKEETHFGHRTLTYILKKTNQQQVIADYYNDTIIVFMPIAMAAEWAATERVGFEIEQGVLSIVIEKDFECLDNVAENQRNNYPSN